MSIQTIINALRSDGPSIALVFILLSGFIEIIPIKINPISAVFKWISSKMNHEVIKKIEDIETKLDNHIQESDRRDVRNCRELILNFGGQVIGGHKRTKEEYEFILSECDKYESYCHENNIPNGVATATISEIKRLYTSCLQNNSFLQ